MHAQAVAGVAELVEDLAGQGVASDVAGGLATAAAAADQLDAGEV